MPPDTIGSAEGSSPIFISVKEAAQRLGLKPWDVYELVRKGELRHLPYERNEKIRVYADDLPRWARDNVVTKTEESA